MKKLISIIIPCYNVENYIDRCVESLVSQSIGLDNLELIFVNDASDDNTLDRLFYYEKLYENSIIVVNLEYNIKQGGARNIGIGYASADYIGFVDADDWIEPSMYEKLYNKIIEKKCDIIACDFIRDLGKGDSNLGINGLSEKLIIIDNIEERKKLLLHGIKGGVWSKLYNRNFLIDNNIFFPERVAYEDNFFAELSMFYVNSYYVVEEILYHYFVNIDSTVLKRNSSHHFDRLKVELLKLEEFENRGLIEYFHDEIEYNFLILFFSNTLHTLFLRFDIIPYNIYLFMRNSVIKHFPSYLQNKYISEKDKWWLNLIKECVSEEYLNQFAKKYIELINQE